MRRRSSELPHDSQFGKSVLQSTVARYSRRPWISDCSCAMAKDDVTLIITVVVVLVIIMVIIVILIIVVVVVVE